MSKKNSEKDKITKEDNKLETKHKDYIISYARQLEQELHSIRNEINRLRESPLVGAVIIAVIDKDKGRYAVQSSRGPYFVVNASRKVKDKDLEIGTFVALNQRTFAIMDILNIDLEDYKRCSRVIFTGQNLLEQLTVNQKTIIEYIKKIDKLEEQIEVLNNKIETSNKD